jgi:hypothetical protein
MSGEKGQPELRDFFRGRKSRGETLIGRIDGASEEIQ